MRQELRQVACAVASWAEHCAQGTLSAAALHVRQRADPALTPAQPVRVVAKYALDRGRDSGDGIAATRPRRGQQDQAGMHPALRQPLSPKRPEVLDVIRDDGPAFAT